MTDRMSQWKPQPRPEWVQRINDEGACMNISGVVPLDEDSLLKAAMRSTGLSDFGTDEWREPFRVLVKSLEEDAALNLMGRIRTRFELLQLLEARLQIEDSYKRHPEIEDEKIERPIFIIGQGRSGTSFFVNLLAQDPDNGVLKHWEVIYPCPPPEKATYLTDPRIARGHAAIDQWNRVMPNFASMHELAGELPMEDCQVLALTFMSPSWIDHLGQVAAYDAYMLNVQHDAALRYHKRVLKLLQWRNPRKRWVLKDPTHIDKIEALFRVYPDALLAWPHRDPVKALASLVNLIGTIQWGRSDFPFKGATYDYMTDPELAAGRLGAFIDKIETGIVPKSRLFNVQYQALIADPVGTVSQLYEYFGIEFTGAARQAIQDYLNANPRDGRPPHQFARGSDETIARERQAFKRYQDHFGVASEWT